MAFGLLHSPCLLYIYSVFFVLAKINTSHIPCTFNILLGTFEWCDAIVHELSTIQYFKRNNTYDFSIKLNRIEFHTVSLMANGNSWSSVSTFNDGKYFWHWRLNTQMFNIKYHFTNQNIQNWKLGGTKWWNKKRQ